MHTMSVISFTSFSKTQLCFSPFSTSKLYDSLCLFFLYTSRKFQEPIILPRMELSISYMDGCVKILSMWIKWVLLKWWHSLCRHPCMIPKNISHHISFLPNNISFHPEKVWLVFSCRLSLRLRLISMKLMEFRWYRAWQNEIYFNLTSSVKQTIVIAGFRVCDSMKKYQVYF